MKKKNLNRAFFYAICSTKLEQGGNSSVAWPSGGLSELKNKSLYSNETSPQIHKRGAYGRWAFAYKSF